MFRRYELSPAANLGLDVTVGVWLRDCIKVKKYVRGTEKETVVEVDLSANDIDDVYISTDYGVDIDIKKLLEDNVGGALNDIAAEIVGIIKENWDEYVNEEDIEVIVEPTSILEKRIKDLTHEDKVKLLTAVHMTWLINDVHGEQYGRLRATVAGDDGYFNLRVYPENDDLIEADLKAMFGDDIGSSDTIKDIFEHNLRPVKLIARLLEV